MTFVTLETYQVWMG